MTSVLFFFLVLVMSVFIAEGLLMEVTVNCPEDPILRKAILEWKEGDNFIVQCSEKSIVVHDDVWCLTLNHYHNREN